MNYFGFNYFLINDIFHKFKNNMRIIIFLKNTLKIIKHILVILKFLSRVNNCSLFCQNNIYYFFVFKYLLFIEKFEI